MFFVEITRTTIVADAPNFQHTAGQTEISEGQY
jgi:hypothetical protein